MLHLSFTQQLCHVAKYEYSIVATNDDAFGNLEANEVEKLEQERTQIKNDISERLSFQAVKEIAQAVLGKR